MTRRYYMPGQPRSYNRRLPILRKGRTFRRGNKLVRHVYRGSKKIGTEVVKTIWSGAKAGGKRYIAKKTYDRLNYYGPRRFFKFRRFS